jgi:kumamolisin
VVCLIAALLTSCGGSSSTATTSGSVSAPSGSVKIDLGLPQKALQAPVISSVPDNQAITLNLTFTLNPQAVAQIEQSDTVKAGSSTAISALAQKIGISDQAYQRIKTFFSVNGAKLQLSPLHTDLTIVTDAGTLSNLLHTKFVLRQTQTSDQRDFYTPDMAQPPVLPAAIASSVEAIIGLDNYTAIPVYHENTVAQIPTQTQQALAPNCINYRTDLLLPSRIAQAYGYNQLWNQGWNGQGHTVNILGFDGVSRSDLDNYFYCNKFQGKFAETTVDKGLPLSNGGESTLDVEMAASVAPASQIHLYVGDHSQMGVWDNYATLYVDLLQNVINDNVARQAAGDVVSLSWGVPEAAQDTTFLKALDQRLWILTNIEHMTVFSATGDCGAFDEGSGAYNQLSVDAPASSPWSVAVGGTKLTLNSAGDRSSESVWSDAANVSTCNNRWGSGGGVSQQFALPSWQHSAGTKNKYSTGKRQLPDVSAVAVDIPVYSGGRWVLIDGTSASAPIWAANMALINQGLIAKSGSYSYGPATFYQLANNASAANSFYDVTAGTNLHYPATAGWDYASGLGTPNSDAIYTNLLQKA